MADDEPLYISRVCLYSCSFCPCLHSTYQLQPCQFKSIYYVTVLFERRNYVRLFQVELLEKLQLKSLAALSAASGTSADSDSDASTVKNVPLKMNSPGGREDLCIDFVDKRIIVGQRKWKVQNMQFHKDLDSAKHVSSKVELVNGGNNNNNNNNMITNNNHKTSAMNDRGQDSPKGKKGSNRPSSKNGDYPRNIGEEREKKYEPKYNEPKQSHPEKPREPENRRLDPHPHNQHEQHVHDEDSDSCSCVTCNTCHLSDCSCSEMSSASHSSRLFGSIIVGFGETFSYFQVLPFFGWFCGDSCRPGCECSDCLSQC